MKLVALGGSLRPHSYSYQILKLAINLIESKGAQIELIDLRHLSLPFCDGSRDYPDYPDVEELRKKMKHASGILIATPEYHGSLTGVLKNVFDILSEEELSGKIVGLIAILGGVHSTNAINTLRIICRHLHAWVLPEQLVIPQVSDNFDEKGELTNLDLRERLEKLINSFVSASQKLSIHP